MSPSTDIPKEIDNDEIVCFLAERYHTTTQKILQQFLEQNRHNAERITGQFRLEENEMNILREMINGNQT